MRTLIGTKHRRISWLLCTMVSISRNYDYLRNYTPTQIICRRINPYHNITIFYARWLYESNRYARDWTDFIEDTTTLDISCVFQSFTVIKKPTFSSFTEKCSLYVRLSHGTYQTRRFETIVFLNCNWFNWFNQVDGGNLFLAEIDFIWIPLSPHIHIIPSDIVGGFLYSPEKWRLKNSSHPTQSTLFELSLSPFDELKHLILFSSIFGFVSSFQFRNSSIGHPVEAGDERNLSGACLLCDNIDIFGNWNLHIFCGHAEVSTHTTHSWKHINRANE